MNISDIHSHNQSAPDAIINIDENTVILADKFYSVGIHPWQSDKFTHRQLSVLTQTASLPQILAIGECGLDSLKGDVTENQIKLLEFHIKLSETIKKPLILHIVKCFPQIIALKKKHQPSQAWIIHGFRGKPQLAEELIKHGFYLSFGDKYNPISVKNTPIKQLFVETDTSSSSIDDITAEIAKIRQIPVSTLIDNITENISEVFKTKIDCRHDNQSS